MKNHRTAKGFQRMIPFVSVAFTMLVIICFSSFVTPTKALGAGNRLSQSSQPAYEMPSIDIRSEDLKAIAEKYAHVPKLHGSEAEAHNAKVDDILCNASLSEAEKDEYLAALGVYPVYSNEAVEMAASQPGDVTLFPPIIRYDTKDKVYIITGSGY